MLLIGALALTGCVLSMVQRIHGVGFWLLTMLLHGALVDSLGDSLARLPLVVGVAVTLTLVVRNQWAGISLDCLALLLALVLLMSISAVLGANQNVAFNYLIQYGKNIAAATLVAGFVHHPKDMRTLSVYLLVGVGVGGLLAIHEYVSGRMVVSTIYDQRAGGLRGDPNDAAMLMVPGIAVACYWYCRVRLMWALLALGALSLVTAGIILTGSRGGFLAACTVVLCLYASRPTVKGGALIALIVMLGALMAPAYYKERMSTVFTGNEMSHATSLSKRGQLLKYGVIGVLNHPLIGVGSGNFSAAYLEAIGTSSEIITSTGPYAAYMAAHNLYLEFFVEHGIPAGCVFLVLMLRSWRAMWCVRDDARDISVGVAFAAGFAGMLVAGLFLSQGRNPVLWLLVGIGMSAARFNWVGAVRSKTDAKSMSHSESAT
jgi:O-antigen ligase